MIRLSLRRYSFVLFIQMFFLVSDLVFNSVGVFFKEKKSITFLYFLQDAFLILSLASLVYSCYSTYVYQAGLTEIINRQFRAPVLITLFYIILSLSLHICSIYCDVNHEGVWPKAITTLFVIQKLCE
jgi:transmembrane protein 138